ncbi:MAG: hypothetical protein E7437_04830 [Ruminococcaceae bacterium]|nr:hypothetical protein [Oscillospiraceae bacterium]
MRKDKRKLFTAILAGFMALVMLLGLVAMIAPVVSAAPTESSSEIKKDLDVLKEKQQQILDEISGLESQISANMDDMEEVVLKKNLIDQEIFLLTEQVTNINAQITAYSALIADKQQQFEEAQAELEDMKQRNKYRLRAMEKNTFTSYWSVVFQADSFLDMLDRIKMIQEIQAADRAMIAEFRAASDAVAAAKKELEAEKASMEQTRQELADAQLDLEGKREEADAILTELVAKGQAYEELVEDAESRKHELSQEIDQVQDRYDEAKRYEQLLQNQHQGGSGNTSGNITPSGTWLVPINYTYFSSPYGNRWHPVYGGYRFHYGVDLAAPQGTPIYASRSGRVTNASYNSSAGYHVNIDHGDGYTSVYMHMTHYIVSYGQQVTAGQIIGYCGSTGASTGPHLHFGIYLNGSSVNPALYIPI